MSKNCFPPYIYIYIFIIYTKKIGRDFFRRYLKMLYEKKNNMKTYLILQHILKVLVDRQLFLNSISTEADLYQQNLLV